MTTEEAVWLVEVFLPKWNHGLRGNTMDYWYEAERILKGADKIEPRSCPCHWKGLAMEVKARYSQHQETITKLYEDYKNPTPEPLARGRKRKS